MPKEIEYKFLLKNDEWRNDLISSVFISQAYIKTAGARSVVRIRIVDSAQGLLTVKGNSNGASRDEYEYQIPLSEAREMMERLCDAGPVLKTRNYVKYSGQLWAIDVFDGDNCGLVVAEIELNSENEDFVKPPWLGQNITDDCRYSNFALAVKPYKSW